MDNDIQRVQQSTFCYIYKLLNIEYQYSNPQLYLTLPLPHNVTTVIAQLRTCNTLNLKLYFKHNIYAINPSEICQICNMMETEDLYHLLVICPLYTPLREILFTNLGVKNKLNASNYFEVLNIDTKNRAVWIYNYFYNICRLRSFCLGQ